MYTKDQQEFLVKLARTRTGKQLIDLLEAFERYYADIRNLKDVDAKVRVDALTLLREGLLDKLKVLSSDIETPERDEWA